MKMKLYKPKRDKDAIPELINKILLVIIGALIGLILVGTIIGFISKKAKPGRNLRTIDPSPEVIESLNKKSDTKIAAYTEIDTLRILTAADATNPEDEGSTLVLTPWLSYQEDNFELYEELSKKHNLISGTITSFFSTKSKEQLLLLSENEIKAQLLRDLNSQLTLGNIEQIFFTDYLFLN